MSEIKNVNELREDLIKKYSQLNRKEISIKEAKSFTDLAGKIINSCKIELMYARQNNKSVSIKFIENNQ